MEIKCVVEKIDRDVNEIMNLKYPYLPEKYFKKYLENEDKFSKLGIIINDYLEKILSLKNENVYVDNAKDVERILNYYFYCKQITFYFYLHFSSLQSKMRIGLVSKR